MAESTYSTDTSTTQGAKNHLGFRLTVFTKDKDRNGDDCLSKRISLVNGEPKSDGSACKMGSGVGKTVELGSFEAVAELISNTPSNSAISIGVAKGKDPGASYKVITREAMKKPDSVGSVTRTLACFEFARGAGLLLADWDLKSAPASVRVAVASKGVDGVLADLCPELAGCGRVYRESTSSNLSHNGHVWSGSGGAHGYIGVEDATDIPRATEVLMQRAWLRGYGWIWISESGSLLVRSPIDKAVASPERLVFEGAPIIVPPLVQGARKARAVVGGLLDTRQALPDLTLEEQHRFKALVEAAKREAEPEAARVRALWMEARVGELVRKGVPEAKAREVVKRQFEARVLIPENEIYFSEFGWVSVGEVLKNPAKYEGCTCADPDEPSYHSGKDNEPDDNCAVFYARRGGGYVYSQAHGGLNYDLCHDFDSINAMMNGIRSGVDPEAVLEVMAQAQFKGVIGEFALARLKKSLGHEVGVETRKIDPMLNKVKKDIVDKDKVSREAQLYRNDEAICHYWLAVDGEEKQPITVRELNDQRRLQDWFLARRYTPLDPMSVHEFAQWRNGLLENVIVVPNSDLLKTHAWIVEQLAKYIGSRVLFLVRDKGQEFLSGKCGDFVRVNMKTRRFHIKWNSFSDWCWRMNLKEAQIEDIRLWLDSKAEYLDKTTGRDWWRCTYGIDMSIFDDLVVHQWLNP